MPKKIFSQFDGGLQFADRNIPDNSYNEGRDVDPFLIDGYISPSFATSTVTENNSEINDLIIDAEIYGDDAFFLDQSDRIYHMADVDDLSWDTNFDGASHSYKAITNAVTCYDLIKYNVSGVDTLFYSYDVSNGAYVGSYNLASPSFSLTKMTLGSGSQGYNHPLLEWNSILWIGNVASPGKMGKYVGSTDTFTALALDLGSDWEITDFLPTRNYIGICAKRGNLDTSVSSAYQSECRIFFWDGVSANWTYYITVNDGKITRAINHNDKVFLFTNPKYDITGNSVGNIRQLTENSSIKIKELKVNLSGTSRYFSAPSLGAVDIFGNRIIFGGVNNYDSVFSFGGDNPDSNALTILFSGTAAYGATNKVGMVKVVKPTQILFSYYDGTNYGLKSIAATKSTNALYKAGYTDFGQKVRINYVKFYFKPLVASDSVTPTLEVDYGTSVTLKDPRANTTISFSNDGAITSKKFMVMKDCHAFRPILTWGAGGVAFSKIVIDYDFIEDT